MKSPSWVQQLLPDEFFSAAWNTRRFRNPRGGAGAALRFGGCFGLELPARLRAFAAWIRNWGELRKIKVSDDG